MKCTLALSVLICALSFCSLADRLTNRNGNQSEESSSPPNANQSNVNSSPAAVSTPPSPPGSNQNSTAMSGGMLNGQAISKPDPVYPPVARAARASGTVTVQVTVDETGKVTSAKAVSGHPLLQAAAVQAAYQARFKPTLSSGKPVKVTGVLTYEFQPQ